MAATLPDFDALPGHGRLIVAFSGGPDSTCLLHQIIESRPARTLRCLHVDHGLDSGSTERAERAVSLARTLGADCDVIRVTISGDQGPEADARSARYRALEGAMADGDALLTAHHADDQAETVLLRLLRGAGPEGLAGIPRLRRFGPGWLARPLLDWRRRDIEAWLDEHGLDSIRDPTNDSPDFDRNVLRNDILPALRRHWPGTYESLRRSARLCQGATDFISARIDATLSAAVDSDGALALERLADNSAWLRAESIRGWCIRHNIEPPPGRRLEAFVDQLAGARPDRLPELRWNNRILRLWRGRLWLEPDEAPDTGWRIEWSGRDALPLPSGLGTLELRGGDNAELSLTVRSGEAGDVLQPAGSDHRRDCKRLLADAGVPPWQRAAWPRIELDGRLVALGQQWLTGDFRCLLTRREQCLVWHRGPRRLAAGALESRT